MPESRPVTLNVLSPLPKLTGRGTAQNPAHRFTTRHTESGMEWWEEEEPAPDTQFHPDDTKTILAHNDSPDIPFRYSINPYRGCEHGCIYCYARPTHEYLNLSPGLDFETRIFFKENAPELLRKELAKPRWQPQLLGMSGVTDCYQPVERKLQITRRCLEVLADFRNPVGIVTKNPLVVRDLDLLQKLHRFQAVKVFISVTTLDPVLAGRMEPRAGSPQARLRAIRTLREAGIPVGVMVAPIIPGLTDHETPAILEACAEAGAQTAHYVMLRLPYQVKDLFFDWLATHYPEKREKVLLRVQALRNGQLNESDFGMRMRGRGEWADIYRQMFALHRTRLGFAANSPELSTAHFRNPQNRSLFDPE